MSSGKERKISASPSMSVRYITQGAIIAAVYVVLTLLAAGFDLASGAIQVRFSEVLTILPVFTPAGIPGVTIGCFLANLLSGGHPADVIFGTLATLLGTVGTRALRKYKVLPTLPPVIANAIIIPFVLRYAYGIPDSIPFMMLTVGAGEVITCVIFGGILRAAFWPIRGKIFGEDHAES